MAVHPGTLRCDEAWPNTVWRAPELGASSELMQHLHIDGAYQKVHMGEIRLRGKENMVALNSVTISKGHKMAL